MRKVNKLKYRTAGCAASDLHQILRPHFLTSN